MREDIFQDCLERWNDSNDGEPIWVELAKKHGFTTKDSLRNAFNRERKARGIIDKNPKVSEERTAYKETDDNISIVYANTTLKSKEDVIREYNIDMTKWKIDLFEIKPSQGYRKDKKTSWNVDADGKVKNSFSEDSGKLLIATLYSLRVKFVPVTVQNISLEQITEYFKTKEFATPIKFPTFTPSNKCVLDINTGDWHIGARSFDSNTTDIEQIFPAMMSDIFSRIEMSGRKFTKIFLNPMGDIAHYSSRRQQTERHQIAVEGNGMNPLEIYDTATRMLISTVDRLLEYAPVEMLYVPGNHDGDFLYYVLSGLAAWYRNIKTFSVDLTKTNRKARLFGHNLRGWEHGEISKTNRVHWLANEYGDLWNKDQYRESFSGHLHHEEVIENGGVKTRRLPAIAVTDQWHHANGYTSAIRATMSFIWEDTRLGWADIWQSTGM